MYVCMWMYVTTPVLMCTYICVWGSGGGEAEKIYHKM